MWWPPLTDCDDIIQRFVAGSQPPPRSCTGLDTPGVKPTPTPDGRLRGFAVAGADKKWYWAKAVIDGNDVVVSADEVPAPVAVRYAHRANPMSDCNLYNKEGLPASPFRTDNW